jgi:Zn-dependent protease with chaperone function
MESLYPAGPGAVPATLTAPSPAYRRHAWIAVVSLLGFALLYLGMMGWLGWTAWRLGRGLVEGTSHNVLAAALVGGGAAFLALFMAKALVFIKRGAGSHDIEITAAEQPRLFAFLHRLADEAGAPRPHRVYVSPRVNAAVFYDLSIANLLLPSRKNLEIGLGLVNVLTLSEFKAVLAHEFGHFAQRTMAVGRWVYVAQQIAAHIINRRDAFDTMLAGLSRVDFRIAWVGWVLRLVVWSIRSLVELFFRLVVLAQRALSREMEYQADLVAASLTGSDALVHALHKLGAADDAWDRAVDFAAGQMEAGQSVDDLFAVQTRIIEQLRAVLADPHFGSVPELPAQGREAHRVFRGEMAQPPRMWATHPANSDRENNVKQTYLAAELEARPAWDLFDDPLALRRRVSTSVFRGELPPAAALEESLQRVDREFQRSSLDRRYRGSFLGRSIVRHAATLDALYAPVAPGTDLRAALAALYDDRHDADLDRLRELQQERASLEGLRDGHLVAEGGVVRWRGRDLPKREVPAALETLQAELAPVLEAVHEHDRRSRSLHLAAAQQLDPAWADTLRGLLGALHYAEHTLADLHDANGVLNNTYRVVTADGNVSSGEIGRLVQSCNVVHAALAAIHGAKASLQLGDALAARLGMADWASALPEFSLPQAGRDNLNDWLRAIDSWVNAASRPLSALRGASLEMLLEAERQIENAALSGEPPGPAPAAPQLPSGYAVLLPGNERKRIDKFSAWDRFQMADGWLASLARFAVAASIVGGVLLLGASTGQTTLSIYNGLAVGVVVDADGSVTTVPAGEFRTVQIDGVSHRVVTTTTDGAAIERFEAESPHSAHMVYNVAAAAPLVEWVATYGDMAEQPENPRSGQRWFATRVDHAFTEPPETISTKSGGGVRTVLSAIEGADAAYSLRQVDGAAREAMLRAHALWDDAGSAHLAGWLAAATVLPDFADILQHRLQRNGRDMLTLRMTQDSVEGAERERVCEQHRARADAESGDALADFTYLAIRCLPEGREQNAAFEAAHARWPEHPWLHYATAYGHAEEGRWALALDNLTHSVERLPQMGDIASDDLVRLIRASGGDAAREAEVGERFRRAGGMLAAEQALGWDEQSGMHAYPLLARGDLAAARERAANDPEHADELRVLVAASHGATAAQVQEGLQLGEDDAVSVFAAWPAVALAMREGKDTGTALQLALARTPEDDAEAIHGFLRRLQAGEDPASAHDTLGTVRLMSRGIAYASAAVLLGERCPSTWRTLAQRLLFTFERPYLG